MGDWQKILDDFSGSSKTTTSTKKTTTKPKKKDWQSILDDFSGSKTVSPTVTTKKKKDEDEDKFDFFQKGVFEDGYQFGDVAKAIGGTLGDVILNVGKGAAGMAEGLVDLGAYGVAGIADAAGADEYAEDVRKKFQKNAVEDFFAPMEESLDEYSVLGRTSDSIAQAGGQIAAIILTGGAAGAAGVSATAATTGLVGASSMGSGIGQAYQEGATDGEATLFGAISGASDALSELMFGGLGKGVKALGLSHGAFGLDDILAKKVSGMFSNQIAKNVAEGAIKATGEGLEEVVAGTAQAIGKKLTYMDEKELSDIIKDENLLEQFVVGAVASGISQAPSIHQANKAGTDFVTGYNQDEQAVIDKEIENRIAEAEKDGKELTKRERNAIAEQVEKDLDKGYISIDTIESVLSADDYNTYKGMIDEETSLRDKLTGYQTEYDELGKKQNATLADTARFSELRGLIDETQAKLDDADRVGKRNYHKANLDNAVYEMTKGSRLVESFHENVRANQKFEADVTKYNGKGRAFVQSVIDSGVVDNTTKMHEFVDTMAHIADDSGRDITMLTQDKILDVLEQQAKDEGRTFDRTLFEGKVVDGVRTKNGIILNPESKRALNFVAGHEITHNLEKSGHYGELYNAIVSYGYADYQKRFNERAGQYKGIYADENYRDAINKEVAADMVGDYLFTDYEFVSHLSTKHQNVFQKVWSEIKHLYKLATAGSREARELEKVKHLFEKAYRESGKAQGDTKYSLADSDGKQLTKAQQEYFKDSKMRDENGNLKVMYHGSQNAGFHTFDPSHSDDGISLFFVDRNDVATTYSGTSETYEAKTIRSAEDMNKFLAEIGQDDYEAVERNGQFELLWFNEKVAQSDTAQGIYEEFCWYEGVGEGDANYKVYLNLKNPLEVDAQGRNWNEVSVEFSKDIYDRYQSLTAKEKARLSLIAEHSDSRGRFFVDIGKEMRQEEAFADAYDPFDEEGVSPIATPVSDAYNKLFGGDSAIEPSDFFNVAKSNFSEESIQQFAVKQMNTRDYAQRAKEQGYDGVIFKNIVDNGGFSNGSEGASTVAIAFDSNQIKSVANTSPTADADIRYSLTEYTPEEKKAHNKAVLEHFGKTYKWAETGYVLLDGSKLDLSGKHEGAPGGYRTVDHRDIVDALGSDYGDDTYSGSLVQFMSEGNIRISPESNGINLSVKPNKAQEMALSDFISRARGEVLLDIDDFNGYTVASVEYPRGTHSNKVLNDIREWFDNGKQPEVSTTSQFRYSLSPSEAYAPTFYSHMARVVDDTRQQKLGAASVVPMLRGKGVKQEEIKWSGIEQFLEGKKSVTKLELQEFVAGSQLQIEEKELSDKETILYTDTEQQKLQALGDLYEQRMEQARQLWQEAYEEELPWDVFFDEDSGAAISREIVARNGGMRNFRGIGAMSNAERTLYTEVCDGLRMLDIQMTDIRERAEARQKNTSATNWSQYKLDGGMNYREYLFKMPGSDYRNNAMNAHWQGETGVLAHARVQDFETDDGKMLFIEEIQSDWHNEGHKQGYRGEIGSGNYEVRREKHDWNGEEIFRLYKNGQPTEFFEYTDVPRYDETIGAMRPNTEEEALSVLKAYEQGAEIHKAPDAPFRDNYHEFVLKRLIREAAEKGYNSIGWTTADIQSKRWSDEYAEGYRIEYDQDIPSFLKKYGKKWGAKVGKTEVQTKHLSMDEEANLAFIADILEDPEGYIRNEKGIVEVWSMPITDEMWESVLFEGQPMYSLSDKGQQHKRNGGWNVYNQYSANADKNSANADIAPVTTDVNVTQDADELFPDDVSPMSEEYEADRMDSITDEDMPPEMEAPYYEDYYEGKPAKVDDPFEDRDFYEIGKQRNVKAYQYENPEVKPFFRLYAEAMLGDLRNSIKGEKVYNSHRHYEEGNESAWWGQKRMTTDDIAELLDFGYTYDQIEKGLNAIIEDDGKENNAVSKRIEFMLNDRLLYGYTDINGFEVPANPDYIKLLEEKEITEYSREAFAALSDADAPPVTEDFAPVAAPAQQKQESAAPAQQDIAPVFESKEKGVAEGQTTMFEPAKPKAPAKPKTPAKTAKVLTKEPKAQKKRGVGMKIVNTTVDKGMAVENLAYESGNKELQGKYQAQLPSVTQAEAQYFMEHGDKKNGVKSLKQIRDVVMKSGKLQDFQDYVYNYLNIDRMTLEDRFSDTENRPVYGWGVTADMSRQTVAQLEKENPEFKVWANHLYGIYKYMRQKLVEKGCISQEVADLWEKMYPHYVPIRRVDDSGVNINVPLDTRKTGVNAPVKRAKGGNSDIMPLFETTAMRIEQTYRAIARNNFGIELKNTLGTTLDESSEILPAGSIVRAADRQNYGKVVSYDESSGKYAVTFTSRSGHTATVNLAADVLTPVKVAKDVDSVIETIESEGEALLKPGTLMSDPTFTVFENGERVEFAITEDLYDSLKPANKILAHRFENSNHAAVRGIGHALNLRRDLITTLNPVFSLYRNPVKDLQDLAINSQHPVKTYLNIPRAIKQLATNGQFAEEYHRHGGKGSNFFNNRTNTFDDGIISKMYGKLTFASEFIEEVPRLAEYIVSRQEGRSVEQSMLDAARVTTNFTAGGEFTKFLNTHGFTFLNASVQGASQHVRNFREAKAEEGFKGVTKTLAKYIVAGVPALVLNSLLWDDDEEYEELSDYVKQNYFVIAKTDDGKFVRIPKGRTVAVMSELMQQMQNLVTGDDVADFETFWDLFWNNMAPSNPMENNIIAPIKQVMKNETWYGEDLVPSRLQDLPAEEQYDESTDIFSKWLGERMGKSPYKINYLIDQYSGGVGDFFLPMLTPEAESGDNSLKGIAIAPWKKEMTTDMVLNNKYPGEFYDLRDELTVKANSSKATQDDAMRKMYMDSVSYDMGALYAQKREIQNSSMTDAEKYEAVRDLQKQINELAETGLNSYNNISVDGVYAEIGDRRYNYNTENGQWYEIYETNKDGTPNEWYETEQAVTKALNITPAEYWNNRYEYDYAYKNPERYQVARAVGGYEAFKNYNSEMSKFEADKDEYGRTINGSKQEKIIDYINGLDCDFGEKIILFKSKYPDNDTYNEDIIDYLNSRDDISYSEMETILKYLGFEVDAKGNISW